MLKVMKSCLLYTHSALLPADHIRLLPQDMGSEQQADRDNNRQLLCRPQVQQHVQLCSQLCVEQRDLAAAHV